MFIEVTELKYTDDGNSVDGESMLINTNHIIRLESVSSEPDDAVRIVMSDGKDVIAEDRSYMGLVNEITGKTIYGSED